MIKITKLYSAAIAISVLAIISILISSAFFPFVSQDSGYYLSVIRELKNGSIYFKDIATPYNPLSNLLIGLPKFLFNTNSFFLHLLVNFMAMLASSIILFKILATYNISKRLAQFLSVSCFLLFLIYDGTHIMLEPFSVLFQLVAFYYYLQFKNNSKNSHLFIAGLCISLAFLSKQFGLFIAIPIGLDILLNRKKVISSLVFLVIGSITPLLLLYVYYSFHSISIQEFIHYILGKGVKLDQGLGTGLKYTFKTKKLFSSFVYLPLLVLIPFLIHTRFKESKKVVFHVALVIASFSVFIFGSYDHYYQYTFPYLILLLAFSLEEKELHINKYIYYALIIIGLVKVSFKTGSIIKHQISDTKIQTENTRVLAQSIPNNATVYLSGVSQGHYYLNQFQSINLNRIGFSFPGYFFPQTIINSVKTNDYLVLNEVYYSDYIKYKSLFTTKIIHLKDEKNNSEKIMILKKK